MSNADLVRAAHDGFARGDVHTVIHLLDETVEWHEAEHVPYWPAVHIVQASGLLEQDHANPVVPDSGPASAHDRRSR